MTVGNRHGGWWRRASGRLVFVLVCGVCVMSVRAARESQGTNPASAKDLYQQAVHQEDAVGNVEAALDLYRRALAAKPDRALAARAQLRIGLCLEKLGRPEARQSFETVVREYADQGAVTAEARARLARQISSTPATPGGTGLDAIQLWSGKDIEGAASLSPDGRYLVYSSWTENGNLLVKDLTTGAVRPITRDEALRTSGYPQPWSPKFSPDGNRIAYPWYEREGTSQRIVDRDGANLRIVARGSTGGQMDAVYAWSPDGRQLAINLYVAGQSRLARGETVPLRRGRDRATSGARLSPAVTKTAARSRRQRCARWRAPRPTCTTAASPRSQR